ncbi:MAG: restriction endonuclease subunit S [Eubacterium sp.]|nr:restriction endonuclease subunit S [Eubacterium sp.]
MAIWKENWDRAVIEDVTSRVKVGYVGSCQKDYCDSCTGVPMIRTTNLADDGLNWSDLKFVTKDFHERNKKSQLKRNDILIARHGENGKACIYDSDEEANCLNVVIIEPDAGKALPLFLKYIFDYEGVKQQIQGLTVGSVQSVINTKTIARLEIGLPIIDEQRRIVGILGDIDKKIAYNKAINDNLSEQAHAIFQSWFIDYVPFDGLAPSNWIKTTLGEVCSCELGGTPSRAKPEYWNGNIPWINSGEVNLFRITKPSEMITELGLSKSATKLLPAKTTVIAITGATLGQISLLEIESCANQSVVGVIPNERLPYEFIYPYISSNIQELISHQTGGAQQHINKQNVEGLPIVVPSNDIMNEYVNLVHGYYSSIANNCFENERLAELRDALLPRLMSGDLDVSGLDL